jgi:hypothetical protein
MCNHTFSPRRRFQVGGPVKPFSIRASDAVLHTEPGAERMLTEEPEAEPIKLSELVDAVEFVSVSDLNEHQAYICKRTGRIIFVSEGVDLKEDIEFPDDPEPTHYLQVPHRRDLDLGRRLARISQRSIGREA